MKSKVHKHTKYFIFYISYKHIYTYIYMKLIFFLTNQINPKQSKFFIESIIIKHFI